MSQPDPGPTLRPGPSGLWLLVGIVVLGMGIPAFFKWQVFEAERNRDRILAEAPTTGAGRMRLYFDQIQPRVLEALLLSRFSSREPWIVSHQVDRVGPDGEALDPEVWGTPVAEVSVEDILLEDLTVYVVLPAPRKLGEGTLVGDNAMGVAHFPEDAAPDGRELLRGRVEYALQKLSESLPRDVEGASIRVLVGPETAPEGARWRFEDALDGE